MFLLLDSMKINVSPIPAVNQIDHRNMCFCWVKRSGTSRFIHMVVFKEGNCIKSLRQYDAATGMLLALLRQALSKFINPF